MTLTTLTEDEREVIHACLVALRRVPDLSHPNEFQTRVGLTVEEYDTVVAAWPDLDDTSDDSDACLAINNALNEIAHGVVFEPSVWGLRATTTRETVAAVYRRWAIGRGWRQTGIR